MKQYSLRFDKAKMPSLVLEHDLPGDGQAINSPDDVYEVLKSVFSPATCVEEHVWMIALDARKKVKGLFEIAHGTYDTCTVDNKQVLIRALLSGASGIIIAHNHPSGDPTPSEADFDVTEKIKNGCTTVGMSFFDHLIIGDAGKCYAMSIKGYINC